MARMVEGQTEWRDIGWYKKKGLESRILQVTTVLPLRFCGKVEFFLGRDKATAEGRTSLRGGPRACSPENCKNCNADRAILQHLGKNSPFFPC